MSGSLAEVLAERAGLSGLSVPPALAERLIAYYSLLSHWNRKINLTSLSDPKEAVDRLLLEPVAAAASLPSGLELVDLGSGGGSPAVPLALALAVPQLVMVEYEDGRRRSCARRCGSSGSPAPLSRRGSRMSVVVPSTPAGLACCRSGLCDSTPRRYRALPTSCGLAPSPRSSEAKS